jgi:hypothetical protein
MLRFLVDDEMLEQPKRGIFRNVNTQFAGEACAMQDSRKKERKQRHARSPKRTQHTTLRISKVGGRWRCWLVGSTTVDDLHGCTTCNTPEWPHAHRLHGLLREVFTSYPRFYHQRFCIGQKKIMGQSMFSSVVQIMFFHANLHVEPGRQWTFGITNIEIC